MPRPRTLLASLALALLASACTSSAGDTTAPVESGDTSIITTTGVSPVQPDVSVITSGVGATTAPPVATTTSPEDTLQGAPDGTVASVVTIIDGDSITVDIEGTLEEVRLTGINSPEHTECYGSEAEEALTMFLGSGRVVLVAAGPDDRDRFDRLLRYVYAGPENVNELMIGSGHAVAIATEHPQLTTFRDAYDTAWQQRNGMWFPAACGPDAPPDVKVVDFTFDPQGPDGEDLNGEWVDLENRDSAEVVIGGWILRDESTAHRYLVPEGFPLAPGASVRIHIGCGKDSADTLYWCNDVPVFNNSGDSVILFDATGNPAARIAYDGVGF